MGVSLSLALLAALCGLLEDGAGRACNLSCARSHERGALSRAEGDCVTLCSPNRLNEQESRPP